MAANVQSLAMWRYSVLSQPGLVLIKDMKMSIYSKAGFIRKLDMSPSSDIWLRTYSSSRHIAKPHVVCSFFLEVCRQLIATGFFQRS